MCSRCWTCPENEIADTGDGCHTQIPNNLFYPLIRRGGVLQRIRTHAWNSSLGESWRYLLKDDGKKWMAIVRISYNGISGSQCFFFGCCCCWSVFPFCLSSARTLHYKIDVFIAGEHDVACDLCASRTWFPGARGHRTAVVPPLLRRHKVYCEKFNEVISRQHLFSGIHARTAARTRADRIACK